MSSQVSHFESPRPVDPTVTGKTEAQAHLGTAGAALASLTRHLLLAEGARRLAQRYAGSDDPHLAAEATRWATVAAQADATARGRAALNAAHTNAASGALSRG